MTVVSALFMLPAGMIFPALVRAANTPPASQTLDREIRREMPKSQKRNLYDDGHARQQTEREADDQAPLTGDRRICLFTLGEKVSLGHSRFLSFRSVFTEMSHQASMDAGLKRMHREDVISILNEAEASVALLN